MFNRKIGTISWKIHRPYEGMAIGGGTPTYTKEVTGNGYIDLTDAVVNKLLELKAYGGTEQRNLPSEYTQVEYLQVATDWVYFSTGINATVDTDMEITASNITAASAQLLVAQCVSGGDYFRVAKASVSQRLIGNFGSSSVTDNNSDGVTKFTARVNKSGFYINGSLVGTFSNIPSSFTGVGEIDIFRGKYSDLTYYTGVGSRFYKARINDNIFLPCKRNSDNQLGIYNTKTGQFILPSGTGTFTAGADVVVPTPSRPIDIVCNNGAIKVSPNLFNPADNNLVINYAISSTGVIEPSPNNFCTDGFMPVKPNTNYVLVGRKADNTISAYNRIFWYDSSKTFISRGSYTLNTATVNTSPSNAVYARVCCSPNNSSTTITLQQVKEFNWIFQQGDSEPTYLPYGIYTDGTVETVEVFGNNLIDLSAVTNGYYYDPQGNYLSSQNSRLTDYIPIEAGKDVRVYFKSLVPELTTLNVRINIFNSNKVWQSQEVLQLPPLADGTKIITPTANGYIRVSANYSGTSIVDWNTASITNVLGTATCEDLLGVGDYKDEQEILSGNVITNVGVLVLDGTENWTLIQQEATYKAFSLATNCAAITNRSNRTLYCTHFDNYIGNTNPTFSGANVGKVWYNARGEYFRFVASPSFTDLAAWKQRLADQYNAGTPVIVIYPLATPTTLSVAGQSLSIPAGNSRIEIVEGSILDLPLYAKYNSTTE